jgi:DNA-binding NtrC family response regulator
MTAFGREGSKAKDTILVIDDEVLVRLAISEYLRDCGFRVVEAADAEEAVRVLERAPVVVDIVFADIKMPGRMDGFGLAQWIRADHPGLEVILAGSVRGAVNAASELCGEKGSIPKSYQPQAVLDRIRRLLATRSTRKPLRGAP